MQEQPQLFWAPAAKFTPAVLAASALLLGIFLNPWALLALPFVLLGALCASPNFNLASGFLAIVALLGGGLLALFHGQAGGAIALGALLSWLGSSIERLVRIKPCEK